MSFIPMKNLFVQMVIFTALLFLSQSAMAHSCEREKSYTLAEAFLKADSVFAGIALNERPDGHLFQVTEWYQSPNSRGETGDKVLIKTLRGGYEQGIEYIIFGVGVGTKAEYPVIADQPCLGSSGVSAEEIITRLRKWLKDPEELKAQLTSAEDLVFIGKVTQVKIMEKQRAVLNKPPQNYVYSEIELEVTELFKNESHRKSLKEAERIWAYTRSCGRAYDVGQSYLVFVSDDYQRRTKEEKYSIQCMPPSRVINVDEKTRLYELGEASGYKRK